jgi:hypothetical protein
VEKISTYTHGNEKNYFSWSNFFYYSCTQKKWDYYEGKNNIFVWTGLFDSIYYTTYANFYEKISTYFHKFFNISYKNSSYVIYKN